MKDVDNWKVYSTKNLHNDNILFPAAILFRIDSENNTKSGMMDDEDETKTL